LSNPPPMPARGGLSSCFDRRLSGGFRFDIRARSLLSSYTSSVPRLACGACCHACGTASSKHRRCASKNEPRKREKQRWGTHVRTPHEVIRGSEGAVLASGGSRPGHGPDQCSPDKPLESVQLRLVRHILDMRESSTARTPLRIGRSEMVVITQCQTSVLCLLLTGMLQRHREIDTELGQAGSSS